MGILTLTALAAAPLLVTANRRDRAATGLRSFVSSLPGMGSPSVVCEGQPEENYCDCEGDCNGNHNWCACEEAQACCQNAPSTGEDEYEYETSPDHNVANANIAAE